MSEPWLERVRYCQDCLTFGISTAGHGYPPRCKDHRARFRLWQKRRWKHESRHGAGTADPYEPELLVPPRGPDWPAYAIAGELDLLVRSISELTDYHQHLMSNRTLAKDPSQYDERLQAVTAALANCRTSADALRRSIAAEAQPREG